MGQPAGNKRLCYRLGIPGKAVKQKVYIDIGTRDTSQYVTAMQDAKTNIEIK